MTGSDPSPFETLGLDDDAGLDEVLAARRRLAKRLHPDIGGDPVAMQRVNDAVGAALRILTERGSNDSAPEAAPGVPNPNRPDTRRTVNGATDAERRRGDARRRLVLEDHPSFTVDALPVVAHAALGLVAAEIGHVLVDESPYLLEVAIDSLDCWCRLEIVPDAGSCSVGVTVSAVDPDLEATRDLWVARLNALDWSQLSPD